jgi:hypothetical protein
MSGQAPRQQQRECERADDNPLHSYADEAPCGRDAVSSWNRTVIKRSPQHETRRRRDRVAGLAADHVTAGTIT